MTIDEDSDDKVRRNLVAVSGAVVLGAWLNLEPQSIIKKLLGGQAGLAIESWRIWSAICALLLYLAMRYRFSTMMKEAVDYFRVERESTSYGQALSTLQKEMARYAKPQRDSDAPSFTGPLGAVLAEYRGGDRSPISNITFQSLTIHDREAGSPYAGATTFSTTWTTSQNSVSFVNVKAAYRISWRKRALIYLVCWSKLLTYSKTSTTLFVPIILCVAALLCTFWRLIQSVT